MNEVGFVPVMPDAGMCEAVGLPVQLLCRRGDVLRSKIGVSEKSFDKAVQAGALEGEVLEGETRRRYYVAEVLRVFAPRGVRL